MNGNSDCKGKGMKAYLAHGGAIKERGKQLQVKLEALGFEVLNPFVIVNQSVASSSMVEKELRTIEGSDILVAIVTPEARATHMEVFYSSRILQHPTFVLYDTQVDPGRIFHPWYDYLTSVWGSESELLRAIQIWKNFQDE